MIKRFKKVIVELLISYKISKLSLKPEDILLIECNKDLRPVDLGRIAFQANELLKKAGLKNKALIVDCNIKLSVKKGK